MNQEAIGKFISACRKDKGLTQIQLAEKLNITNRAVSKWETGKSCPDASIMLKLCDILDITATELLSGERIRTEGHCGQAEEDLVPLQHGAKQPQENLLKITINEQIQNIHKIQALRDCVKDKSPEDT